MIFLWSGLTLKSSRARQLNHLKLKFKIQKIDFIKSRKTDCSCFILFSFFLSFSVYYIKCFLETGISSLLLFCNLIDKKIYNISCFPSFIVDIIITFRPFSFFIEGIIGCLQLTVYPDLDPSSICRFKTNFKYWMIFF